MRTLATIAVMLGLAATGCKSNGTYVVLKLDKGATTPPGITQLDLSVMLGGRSANVSVNPGHEITFPNDVVLTIGAGTGALTVDVVARDASGAMVDHGHGEGTVVSGSTTTINIALAGGGGGGVLTVDKMTVDFGTVVVGQSSANATIMITNGGTVDTGALTVTLGNGTDFAIVTNGCAGMVLMASSSCSVSVKMTPTSAGALSTMLTVSGSPGGSIASTLSGAAVVPGPLTLSPAAHDFGDQTQATTSAEFTFTATNAGTTTTGALAVDITGSDASSFTVSNDQCTGKTLNANGQCPIGVTLSPGGSTTPGAKSATLTVTGMPGGVGVATLSGNVKTPAHLSMTYTAGAFGSIAVGATSGSVDVTVTNDGGTASGALSAASLAPNTEFMLVSDGCSTMTLNPTGSCIIKVTFSPSATGPRSAMLSTSATPGGTASTTLMGTGLTPAMISIGPSPYDFMIVDVNSMATQTFTVKNNGEAASGMLGGLSVGASTVFTTLNDNCTGMSLPKNGTCTFDVKFAPNTYGPFSATVSITSTPGGTASSNLSGTGRDFVTLTVTTSGTGTGTVAATGVTLSCAGSVCTGQFARTGAPFTVTTLSAAPDVSSTFSGFTGAGCNPAMGTCDVTMDMSQNVTATFTIKTVTITVVLLKTGVSGGAPSVTSTDATINCGAACSHTYTYSASNLTLNETPGSFIFYGWSGASCGKGTSCAFPLTQDRVVTASFGVATPSYMFVTSTTQLPSAINGLAGADTICNTRATAAGLPGTYSAWLSDSTTNARDRVGAGGWIRTDGRPFAAAIGQLTGPGQIFYGPRVDEFGNDLGGGAQIFIYGGHNSFGQTFMSNNCSNWTSNMGNAYIGQASGASLDWSYDQLESGACSIPHRIYCMRSDTNVAVSNPPVAGRYAFLSKNAFVPGGAGLGKADTQCRADATAAGLASPNTYVAFLANGAASASSRVSLAPGTLPFKRLDDTLIVASPGDLAAGAMLAVPNEFADATGYGNNETWSGAADPSDPGTFADTCIGWTVTTGNGLEGAEDGTYSWLNFFRPACSYGFAHILCFQP